MEYPHHRKPSVSEKKRAYGWVLLINLIGCFIELSIGAAYGSLSLWSDGAHMSIHVVVYFFAYLAVFVGEEARGAKTGAWLLCILAFWLIFEVHFYDTTHAHTQPIALFVAIGGLVANGIQIWILQKSRVRSTRLGNVVSLHAIGDLVHSMVAILGMLLGVFFPYWPMIDIFTTYAIVVYLILGSLQTLTSKENAAHHCC